MTMPPLCTSDLRDGKSITIEQVAILQQDSHAKDFTARSRRTERMSVSNRKRGLFLLNVLPLSRCKGLQLHFPHLRAERPNLIARQILGNFYDM